MTHVREIVRGLQPGDHVLVTSADNAVSLLTDGLEKNELCCYIGDRKAEIKEKLKKKAIKLEISEAQKKSERVHQAEFLSFDQFLDAGSGLDQMIEALTQYAKKALAQGFSRLRVVQDMGALCKMARELAAYETKITEMCSELSMICVCFYHFDFPPSYLLEGLKTHPLIMTKGLLCKNMYYVPGDPSDAGSQVKTYFENVSVHDIDDVYRQNEENLKFLAEIVENVMEAVVITGDTGVITYVNPPACSMFGYTREELQGEPANILNSKSSPVAIQEIIEQRNGWEGEMLAIKKDGERFPIWLKVSTLQNEKEKVTAFISVARDITDQKEAEEKLQRYALLLEMKVREKTKGTETLLKTSYALRSTSNWKKGADIITRGIVEGLGFDRAAVFFVNEHQQVLECKGQVNMSEKLLRVRISLKDDRYAVAKCVQERRPLLVKDATSDTRVKSHLLEEAEEFVWVPILFQSKVLGAIGADRKRSTTPIESEDVDMLELYANQVAEFIERTRLVVEPEIEPQVSTPLKYDLGVREVYLVEGEQPDMAYDMFADLVKHGFRGFGVCRTHPEKIREEYALEKTPIMWLSEIETKQLEHVGPQDTPKLSYVVAEFIKRAQPAVVILEGVEYLVVQNDFDTVLKLLHTLSDYVVTSQSILLLPINPAALPPHQYIMLKRAFRAITEEKQKIDRKAKRKDSKKDKKKE